MKLLLDSAGKEITKGQKLRCDTPDSKGNLHADRVYICAGRRNNAVALKGIAHSFAGWRFTIIQPAKPKAAKPTSVVVPTHALEKVIEYLWRDEERHFRACRNDEDFDADNHIFFAVVALKAAIDEEDARELLQSVINEAD